MRANVRTRNLDLQTYLCFFKRGWLPVVRDFVFGHRRVELALVLLQRRVRAT